MIVDGAGLEALGFGDMVQTSRTCPDGTVVTPQPPDWNFPPCPEEGEDAGIPGWLLLVAAVGLWWMWTR